MIFSRNESLRRALLRARHFVRTPKGRLLLLFGVLGAAAATRMGPGVVVQRVLLGMGSAALVDVALRRVLRREWAAPTGALLTGTDAALVLNAYGTWFALPVATAVGIVAKHFLRTRTANVFNPSALGLVVVSMVLGRGLNWWGSLPDHALPGLVVLIVSGALTAGHVNKVPLVLVFLASYFTVLDVAGLAIGGGRVAELFVPPDANAALFFAFFMLTDPPTSPVRYVDQLWYGTLVAVLAVAIFALAGASYFLPSALLIGNFVEAGRRVLQTRRRQSARSGTRPARARAAVTRLRWPSALQFALARARFLRGVPAPEPGRAPGRAGIAQQDAHRGRRRC